ncbi:hypothetical protein BGZ47_008431 [Haplosporangium gracile]|nr:hypothetical protein BGZ47_008431 [Haplosporangium gracile]
MNLSFLVASASGFDAPPGIIQTLPISQQLSQQKQDLQEEVQEQEQQQEQEQEQQEQNRQPQQQLHLQRRVDQGGSATSSGATVTGKEAVPSIFEPYADAEVWEGQASPLRIQLDPQTFVVAASSAGAASSSEVISSAGPITYYAKTDISTTLPSWLKFNTSSLEFSGSPPIGTYKRTTILTITVAASSVPGYTQATDRFTIKIRAHSLSLSTYPLRSCSSSSLYYSQEWSQVWQSYLPDLVLEPQQRHINFQLGAEIFRIDGCSQPARTAAATAALSTLVFNSTSAIHSTMNNEESSTTLQPIRYRAPYITQIDMVLSTETTQELSLFNNTLPSWLSFDHTNWTLTGDLPHDIPERLILDVEVADSFNTSSIFKLQVFSSTTPFSFLHPVPDVWVRRGELFNVDLLPASLLSYPTEATVLPVEHKFLFEPIDMIPSQVKSTANNTSITKLGASPINPLLNTSVTHTNSGCSYTDLWGQQSMNNREAGPSPLIPNWFNHTSFTSNLPIPSPTTTTSSEEGKIALQGHIPCDMILRVRWLVRNSLGQLASTEFMIWANDQGPSYVAKPHVDKTSNQHHGSIGPIGVKVAVGIACATPVMIAIWFMVTRYCKRLRRQDGPIKPTMSGDLEGGRIRSLSGGDENGSNGLNVKSQRRRQPTAEVLPHGEPEYRSSYEDNPSVGHHDSYSEKYVAKHGPHIHTTTSGDEGGSSGSSKRTSILDQIFGDKNPGKEELSAAATAAEMNRRRMSEPLTFSLKKILVGYPFESNRFEFVNGNRISLYDSGAGISTSTNASSPSVLTQQNNTTEPGQVASGTKPSSKPPSESAPRKLSDRSSSIFKKGSRRHSKLVKDKNAINDHATKRDATAVMARRLGIDSACQTVRPCHSFLSNGTGYMASMSECNTSIDERQDSGGNSDEEMEEDRRVNRSNSNKEGQRPWTPSTFLMRPKGVRLNRDVEFVGDSWESEPEYRGLSDGIHHSDSGALMTGSSSMTISELVKGTSRSTKAPSSIMPSFLDLGRASSVPPPLHSWTSTLQVPDVDSDRDSIASFSSSRTAPVTGSEAPFTKEGQPSVHAGPGSFQRRSIVEFLQSNDEPISPLSAFSASLPSWSYVAGSSSHSSSSKGKGTGDGQVSATEENSSASEENRGSIYSIGKEGPHETTKWMVVPSNQTFRNVSVCKNNTSNKGQKETSEWISDPATHESEMARGDTHGKSVDWNSDGHDHRHRSLPYELGTIEPPVPTQVFQSFFTTSTSIISSSSKKSSSATTPVVPTSPSPHSAPEHSHSLSNGVSHMPSIHSQLPLTRHSMDRMRPVSYSIFASAPVANAVIPRRFVKATIGAAFHSTSSIQDPMSSSPSSPRLLTQHTSLSRAMSPPLPPMMSPPFLPSSPPPMSPRSSIFFGDPAAAPLPGEYRAYLVTDPNNVAQVQDLQQQRSGHYHRPSASLSSINVERADLAARPGRKLPEWIQFNSKMRSLWGRPTPGTAGEWQVSMVQTQFVSSPSLASLSYSTTTAASAGSVVTGGQHPTLGQQGVKQQQTAAASTTEADPSLESAVEGEQQQKKEVIVEGEGLQTQDVEVELVVLLVREPGEAPLSPSVGATRSRTFPILAQAQDQALVQAQVQLQPSPSSSLSMSSSQTVPSLATPGSPPSSFISQGQAQGQGNTKTTVTSLVVVEVVATTKESAKPSSVAPISPVSPLSESASAATLVGAPSPSSCASPPCLQQGQQQQQRQQEQQQ